MERSVTITKPSIEKVILVSQINSKNSTISANKSQQISVKRTGWTPFIGLKGGSDTPLTPSKKELNKIKCGDCGLEFLQERSKNRHAKFYCTKSSNLDPIELNERRRMTIKRDPIKETEIHELEKNSVTFSIDEEMEPFILATTSSYAKFRISENPRNPMPIPGFWPALFDY